MTRINAIKVASISLISVPISAFAQIETLDYVGSPFTSVAVSSTSSAGAAAAASDTIPQNTGQIVLAAPLADNLTNAAVKPASYSFDSSTRFGSIYLSSQNPERDSTGNSASFLFSTNASGMVTGWNVSVTGGIFGGTNSPSSSAITINNSGDYFATGFSTPSCASPTGGSCYRLVETNTTKGTFFSSATRAPEIDPQSAMCSMTLLLGGVSVLLGRRSHTRSRSVHSGEFLDVRRTIAENNFF